MRRISLIPALAFLLMLSSCVGDEQIDSSLSLEERIDQLVEPMVIYGNPNACIIGIIKDGERIILSYGDAGLGHGPPLSNTLFEIGSITKTYTATLLSTFIQEGLVELDDPIDLYLPESVVPPTYKGQSITLGHLVTHTSGLPRGIYNFDLDPSVFWTEVTNEDLYDFLNDISQPAYPFDDFTSGNELKSLEMQFRYSNVGMAILGHILELASGQSWEELIEERICSELDMPDTKAFPDLSTEQVERIPRAYNIHQYEQHFPRDFGRMVACGGLFSTMDDMLNYMEANMASSSPLSHSMQKCQEGIFTSEQISSFPRDIDALGMSWMLNFEDGDTLAYHNGGYNHLSYLKLNRTKDIGVVALSNTMSLVALRSIDTIFSWVNEEADEDK